MQHKTDQEALGEQLALFALPRNGTIRGNCPIQVTRELLEITEPVKEFLYDRSNY